MIVCIWFPNWPIQRWRHARPDFKGPLALYDHHRTIIAASVAELVGLSVAEVHGVRVEPHDIHADGKELERLALWCDQFSPIVGIDHDCLLIDLVGLPFDRKQISNMIRALGFAARLAVADTLGAAWALARYDSPLPVEALRLPSEILALLAELGIRQVSELQALPRDQLATRFPLVAQRLDQLHGSLPEPVAAYRTLPDIVVEQSLDHPLERRDMIETILLQMITQASEELHHRQLGAIHMEAILRCQPGEHRVHLGLYQPSSTPKYLCDLLLLKCNRLPGPLIGARVTVLSTAPLEARQRELFNDDHDRRRELALFVDRLNGQSPALRPVLVADAQPEHAFRYERLSQRASRAAKRSKCPRRPLLVEPRPIPLKTTGADGVLTQFQLAEQQYRVTRRWGPERIQTGWWRSGYSRRDYYRVQTDAGSYWLFRECGKWYLHGVFD